LNILRF